MVSSYLPPKEVMFAVILFLRKWRSQQILFTEWERVSLTRIWTNDGGTTERDSIAQSSGCLCFWASGGSKHPKRLRKRRGAKEQIWKTSWLEGIGSDEECHFEQQLRRMQTKHKPRISARKPTKSFGFLSSCGFRAMMEPSRLNIFTVLVILNQSRLILIKTYSNDNAMQNTFFKHCNIKKEVYHEGQITLN